MVPTVYEIKRIGSGKLSVMARPRAGDWASEEFAGFAELGVTDVLSLLQAQEAYELGLASESGLCEAAGLSFRSFSIADRAVPSSALEFGRFACDLYHLCQGGAHLAVHCRAGIGRSGLVAAAILLHDGFNVSEAFSAVSKGRGLTVPDTDEQTDWLVAHSREVSQCHLAQPVGA